MHLDSSLQIRIPSNVRMLTQVVPVVSLMDRTLRIKRAESTLHVFCASSVHSRAKVRVRGTGGLRLSLGGGAPKPLTTF
jgi:hypothetical protein